MREPEASEKNRRQQRSTGQKRCLDHGALPSAAACGALAVLSCLLSSPTAWSQGIPGPEDIPQLGTTQVTDRAERSPAAVTTRSEGLPTPVTVIERDDLERSNYGGEAGDLLRRVPGVMAHNIGQGNVGTTIKMRGFMSLQHGADVAVIIDGVPQNVPSSAINHGMNDMSWLTPDMIERIEVIKGPFSALYGDQNRAGVVNIVTRSRARNSVTVEAGSYGMGHASLVHSGELAGGIQTFFVGDLFHADGYRDHSGADRGSLFFKASALRGEGRWSLRAAHQNAEWDAPGFLTLEGVLGGTADPRGRDMRTPPAGGSARRTSLVLTRDPAQGEAGWQLTGYVEDYRRLRNAGVAPNGINRQLDDRSILGGRLAQNLFWGQDAQLTFGAEVRHDNGTAEVERLLDGVTPAGHLSSYDLNLTNLGLFVQGQYKLAPGLKLIGGARADRFDYDIDNRKLPAASLSYRKTAVTPKLGVVWSPHPLVDLFANMGQGMRSPSQAELSPAGSLGPLGAAGGRSNPNLTPPKVKSYDAGFQAWASERVHVSGAYYHTVNDNEIVAVSTSEYASVGKTTREGWEFEGRYLPTKALSFYASYGRIQRASIDNPAPGASGRLSVPKDTIKVGVAYTMPVPGGNLRLNADAGFLSKVPYFATATQEYKYAPRYARYDLRATYVRKQIELTAYAVIQPKRWATEIAPSATGPLLDPVPRTQLGVAVKYYY